MKRVGAFESLEAYLRARKMRTVLYLSGVVLAISTLLVVMNIWVGIVGYGDCRDAQCWDCCGKGFRKIGAGTVVPEAAGAPPGEPGCSCSENDACSDHYEELGSGAQHDCDGCASCNSWFAALTAPPLTGLLAGGYIVWSMATLRGASRCVGCRLHAGPIVCAFWTAVNFGFGMGYKWAHWLPIVGTIVGAIFFLWTIEISTNLDRYTLARSAGSTGPSAGPSVPAAAHGAAGGGGAASGASGPDDKAEAKAADADVAATVRPPQPTSAALSTVHAVLREGLSASNIVGGLALSCKLSEWTAQATQSVLIVVERQPQGRGLPIFHELEIPLPAQGGSGASAPGRLVV